MKNLHLIYYSPTGTTHKILNKIAQELDVKLIEEYNITSNKFEWNQEIKNNSLTIIGMPTYGGRLPLIAVERLKTLKANGAPVVVVVVYGNRAYEDSLLELKEIVSNCGFKIIAAAAFIGEHSFSTIDKPIAQGRPDNYDLMKCCDFSRMIHSKINNLKKAEEIIEIAIPGNYPYKQRSKLPVSISPETDMAKCTNCGICLDICPSNAIRINQGVITNKEWCTWCCACVKNCPSEARFFDNPTINDIKDRLHSSCAARNEAEFFV
jgi:ferredoxin/protein involved in ribonucleotide reduction